MRNESLLWIFLIVITFPFSSSVTFYDQGTRVKDSNGTELSGGDLTVLVYDSSSGGELILNHTYVNAIVNGSWNVKIEGDFEYGQSYFKDYRINGDDMSFNGDDRVKFESPYGLINNASFFNFSMIEGCDVGWAIRRVLKNGSVVCERVNGSSGGVVNVSGSSGGWVNDSFNTNTSLNVNVVGNVSGESGGFFRWLGSFVSRIGKLFVEDINFNGTINGSGNVSAAYFIGDGSGLSGIVASDLARNSTLLGNTTVEERLRFDEDSQIYVKGGDLVIEY